MAVTKIMTPDDLLLEAQRFLREEQCFNICCDEEDDTCHMSFSVDEDDNLEVEIEHDHPAVHQSYYVTILRKPRFDSAASMPSIMWWYAWQPSSTHTGRIILQDKLEIEFWNKVAGIYPSLPAWMFEYSAAYFDSSDFDSNPLACACETKTIMQQGCQCGGI